MIVYEEDVDEFLEHYGVRGMKWGVRSAPSSKSGPPGAPSTRKEARQRNRQLNRESRARDKAARVKEIEKARERIDTGKTQGELYKARKAHAANKTKLGSREARKILRKARAKSEKDWNTGMQLKNGKEKTGYILAVAGTVAAATLIGAALER